MMKTNQLVLIAGPYRSGTNDDPAKIAENVEAMEKMAYQVYELGHTPILGEWLALPLLKEAGSTQIGDDIFKQLFHTSAIRLMEHCDVVLRIGGASAGADEMVRVGKQMGKQIAYAPEVL
jgi:hypothetical protein